MVSITSPSDLTSYVRHCGYNLYLQTGYNTISGFGDNSGTVAGDASFVVSDPSD